MSIKVIKRWSNKSYDDIIDVRTPFEFSEDHIPSAINLPVLDNSERVFIGKKYKQESPFIAKKIGAAIVSENISKHIKNSLLKKPGHWKPLIYCWRGGQRSKAFATVLSEIGWQVTILDGGYKTYRKKIITNLNQIIKSYSFIVLKGKTGTAKTSILNKLEKSKKVGLINLEKLANHKGSLLGNIPNVIQPSQKYFESLIYHKLKEFKCKKNILIESESSKIGEVFLPKELIKKIKNSPFIEIAASIVNRSNFLCKDYEEFLKEKDSFKKFFLHANKKLGYKIVGEWKKLYNDKNWTSLAAKLIREYYDPLYEYNNKNSRKLIEKINVDSLSEKSITKLCKYLENSYTKF